MRRLTPSTGRGRICRGRGSWCRTRTATSLRWPRRTRCGPPSRGRRAAGTRPTRPLVHYLIKTLRGCTRKRGRRRCMARCGGKVRQLDEAPRSHGHGAWRRAGPFAIPSLVLVLGLLTVRLGTVAHRAVLANRVWWTRPVSCIHALRRAHANRDNTRACLASAPGPAVINPRACITSGALN